MIYGIAVQRIIRQSVFCRKISPFCTSTAIRQTIKVNKEYSKMTYQIEERGSPNTVDYKLYISKSTLKLCKVKCLYKSRIDILYYVLFYLCIVVNLICVLLISIVKLHSRSFFYGDLCPSRP